MFNKNQLLAINSENDRILVLAGAGTGKTKVIIHRIEKLIKSGVNPAEIVVTTFTNKAAMEIKHRLAAIVGSNADYIVTGTFHKISSYFLKKYYGVINLAPNFQVLFEDDQRQIAKQIINELSLDLKPKFIIDEISKIKETNLKNNNPMIKKIYDLYEQKLKENNLLDYSDLIRYAVELFQKTPTSLCAHLLVDEYQDINFLQYEWSVALAKNGHLCCVGDEDQSIYGFRGSDIKYIQNFQKDYPNADIIFLTDNYRSVKEILKGAVNVIGKNDKKFAKELVSNLNEEGKIIVNNVYNEFDEAQLVATRIKHYQQFNYKIAILVRTNMQIYLIESALMNENIPYELNAGKKFYEKKEVKDLIFYLRVINSENDYLAFSHIINVPKRGMGEVKVEQLMNAIRSFNIGFEAALNILIPQMPKVTAQKCQILLNQIVQWRKVKDLSLDLLINAILTDIKYKELEETTTVQNEVIKNFIEYSKQYKTIQDLLDNFHFVSEETEGENKVQIMTMHAAKGLEFDVVLTPGWNEGVFPSVMAKTYLEIQEERRLAYVTITRAKLFLEIFKCKFRKIFGQYQMQPASRFVQEL